MSETQAMMGAIARGEACLAGDLTDMSGAIRQLIGDLKHEQREHEATRDLLRSVERSSDTLIERYRDALVLIAGLDDPSTGDAIGTKHDARELARAALSTV